MSVSFSNSNFTKRAVTGNNSGGGANTPVPDEVAKRFNWGAFLLSWIWGCGNNTFITLILIVMSFIPFVNFLTIFVVIWFGIKGNEWAWQNKKWDSIEHFHAVQRNWAKWGVISTVAVIVIAIVYGIVMASLVAQSLQSM